MTPHSNQKDLSLPALMRFKASSASILSSVGHALVKGPAELSHTDREMLSAYVSMLNECDACFDSPASNGNGQMNGKDKTMASVMDKVSGTPVTEKMKSLLTFANKVQQNGKLVSKDDIDTARKNGASDEDIHDTMIISAAFCMYNRYIDGLSNNSSLINQLP
ncbi:MAG: hypothetical protein Q8S18_03985 [Bacteroidales bacterium]|nr:hypothetical protein [Bacteroidales bacterium]